MRYLILIYENEANAVDDPAEMQKWFDYTDRLQKAGVMLGGEALQPTSTATTVRKQGGRVVTTDGPFAETKEQLGGFYLLECKDLDEAVSYARQIPTKSVEIRPVALVPGWQYNIAPDGHRVPR